MAELSSRYANALFGLATESDLLNEYIEQAVFLREIFETREFLRILEYPDISAADKRGFLTDAFAGKILDNLMGFLYLVIDKNRESFLLPALKEFIRMGDEYSRKTTATVVSAVELDKSQISALANVLSEKIKKQVDVVSKVDPFVIGGISIHMDGYFIDRTVRTQLTDMKRAVKKENNQ